jgi:transaldolase
VPHLVDVQKLGQSIWLDYIQRSLVTSGRLQQMVDGGLRGVTSNPSIFHQAITQSDDYDDALAAILRDTPDADVKTAYERLAVADIQLAADVLRPVYDTTTGVDGMVSLEVSPHLAYDTEATIAEAQRLWQLVDRPNLMIKVPATTPGIPAIETLLAGGININVTLLFSLKQYEAIASAYINGASRLANPGSISSVASFFVSRVDTYVDRELQKIGTDKALALLGRSALANSKIVYRRFREIFYGDAFTAQRRCGARVQRPLWGSTSTKNPSYSDVLYVENLIGPDTVNTLPPETIDAFKDHGQVRRTVDADIEREQAVLNHLAELGIDLDAITEQLQKDGVQAFADSFDKLLAALTEKITEIQAD